jgi:hypothetical protein
MNWKPRDGFCKTVWQEGAKKESTLEEQRTFCFRLALMLWVKLDKKERRAILQRACDEFNEERNSQ